MENFCILSRKKVVHFLEKRYAVFEAPDRTRFFSWPIMVQDVGIIFTFGELLGG